MTARDDAVTISIRGAFSADNRSDVVVAQPFGVARFDGHPKSVGGVIQSNYLSETLAMIVVY
ncbi:hypothetical protein ACSMXN_18430 [Jatrophihabitans sp. DSM 45814]